MMPDGAIMALLLLVSGVSAAVVPPPENLTVSCSNLNVSVSWDFSGDQTQTKFKIDVKSSANTKGHSSLVSKRHFDLSQIVWESKNYFMEYYAVNVTAIQGDHKSNDTGTSFSFNTLKSVFVKCELDFPPVDLMETDSGATLLFMNPLRFYKKLNQSYEAEAVPFSFIASSKTNETGVCKVKDENCKLDIPFAADAEKCVTLKGQLVHSASRDNFVFRKTGLICAEEAEGDFTVAMVVMLFILGIVITMILIFIFKVKAWTVKIPEIPPFLKPGWNPTNKVLAYATVSPVDTIDVNLRYNMCNQPSVSSEEDLTEEGDCSCVLQVEEEEHDRRDNGRDNLPPSSENYSDGRLLEESSGDEDDSADDLVKTEIVSIDVEEKEDEDDMGGTVYMKR
ncbi:interferon gamma receptor 1 isoform X2 [Eleginops maclovinus]|uniref:interferon gamma receptor 1 isoform X2 n=1 Tax=Eleginops maclovinus TaxID=56733 RepID=UPI003080AF52